MSDQEEARIAASRHFDDLYSRWLVHPSPGNRFLNDRYGSAAAIRKGLKLSRYVVANAKVFLDSGDAPQEVIDFFPRNSQGLPLRFLRQPRLFENGGEAEGGRKCGSRTQSQSSLKKPGIRGARFAFGSTPL